ncbi:YggS family pyridoxal phosphate enzyme [Shewanella ulleungensis]|uniref:Pyridoxal phosphate homeostasis protein n=1 Tax=Shewanella ulleungensis TaxID=2282699 RepID=A0ABQ2QKF7_9GAMM|nr:YggS family pyridoxal phosphate enzyme [Shewanella ulleungensis]
MLAVSKTKPINDIIAAYEAGQRQFGENYVQEGETKITALAADYPDIEWHFIGPLQSNKTKIVAEHFDWMHTVSRDKIAQRLNDQRPDSKLPLNVCIQVNISQEDSKSGVDANQVATLALTISQLPNLTLRGLMAIPTATDNTQLQQQEFANLKVLYDQLKLQYPSIDTLSMGMSGDMDIAIANGSTMVRIGSAIFGER